MSRARAGIAMAVVLVMGGAVFGLRMGDEPADKIPAPSAAQVAQAKQRISAGGATVRTGRQAFEDEGCNRCHSIAAIGADGKLGPRLDALDDNESEHIAESITDPRDEIVDGFPAELMPTDFAKRLSADEIQALAAFIGAASGIKEDRGGKRGKDGGRGRRGRGGDDG
jgi:mono/diheme cytochrome c family protein